MKELIKNSRVCGYLEKIYRQLNADMFDGSLETPVITVQSTPRAYGHVTTSRVWKIKDEFRFELNIGAESLDRCIEDVVSTVLHEMVHIYNLMNDIQDVSRGGSYHNKRFKEKAESVGLVVEYDSRIGWSVTSPGEDLIEYIIKQGWSEIFINRQNSLGFSSGKNGVSNTDSDGQKKKSSTRKYICPCCKSSVRATRSLNIICGECMQTMELAG